MTEPTNLWWPMKMVHQIFIKGSAITTHFYYLVYIHQSSSIKCKNPWGYLLLRPKNYWKIPSISALTRPEHTGNILFGQTQRDCLSEHLTSLPLQSLIFHIQCWENSLFFFSLNAVACSPQFIQHPQSYRQSLYHQALSHFLFSFFCFSCCSQ